MAGTYSLGLDNTYNLLLSTTINCPLGYYCPGSVSGYASYAEICPSGYYCPTPSEKYECPSGYFCWPASVNPIQCSVFAYCPSNSSRYFNWGCLLLLVLTALCLFIIYYKQLFKSKIITWLNNYNSGFNLNLNSKENSNSGYFKSAHESIIIEMENLTSSIWINKKEKTIINDISCSFGNGKITGILGESGSSKTTLLEILIGQKSIKQGKISVIKGSSRKSISEHELAKLLETGMIGFVPQSDSSLLAEFTPRELLLHYAAMKLGLIFTREQRINRVNQILKSLKIDHIGDNIIGNNEFRGISGGERKRVSVAIELISNPSLIVLDEPTTGLDSSSALVLMQCLKTLSEYNETSIVCVLHTPRLEIFNLLDNLLLLSKGGYTTYFGPTNLAKDFFSSIDLNMKETVNPPDFYLDAVSNKLIWSQSNQYNNSLVQAWKIYQEQHKPQILNIDGIEGKQNHENEIHNKNSNNNHSNNNNNNNINNNEKILLEGSNTPWYVQTYFQIYRALYQQFIRGQYTLSIELFLHVVAGCIIGLGFTDSNWLIPPYPSDYAKFCPQPMQQTCEQDAVRDQFGGLTNYTLMGLGSLAVIIGCRTFGSQFDCMYRELKSGTNPLAYFIGRFINELTCIIIYSFFYCLAFMLVCSPSISFQDLFAIIWVFELVAFGIGNVCCFLLSDESGMILGIVAALLSALANDNKKAINQICWGSWVGYAIFIKENSLDHWEGVLRDSMINYAQVNRGFLYDQYANCMAALIIYAIVLRIWTFGLLIRQYTNINKQVMGQLSKIKTSCIPSKKI